ncbi:hypothetical protein ACFSC4_31460 [Deinococcus malanensis]|uniref:hypothetical protein n=1 Tax=Deinococcus malanensis TaxID=1706855 RepID=UPI0036308B30
MVGILALRDSSKAIREFEGGDNGLTLLYVPATNVGKMHFAYSMASPNGIKEVHTSVDGAPPTVVPREGMSVWDNAIFEDLTPGIHHIKVTVVDGKGQRYSQVARSVTIKPAPDGIDPRRPELRITGPAYRELEEELGVGPDREMLVVPIEAQDDEELASVNWELRRVDDKQNRIVATGGGFREKNTLRIDLTLFKVPRGTYRVDLIAHDYGGRSMKAKPFTFTY